MNYCSTLGEFQRQSIYHVQKYSNFCYVKLKFTLEFHVYYRNTRYIMQICSNMMIKSIDLKEKLQISESHGVYYNQTMYMKIEIYFCSDTFYKGFYLLRISLKRKIFYVIILLCLRRKITCSFRTYIHASDWTWYFYILTKYNYQFITTIQ